MTVVINKTFVRVRLAVLDWSLTDLAEKSDIHVNTLRRLMNGEVFNSDTLGKLAKALDVNPHDLIEAGEGYVPPHMDAPAIQAYSA